MRMSRLTRAWHRPPSCKAAMWLTPLSLVFTTPISSPTGACGKCDNQLPSLTSRLSPLYLPSVFIFLPYTRSYFLTLDCLSSLPLHPPLHIFFAPPPIHIFFVCLKWILSFPDPSSFSTPPPPPPLCSTAACHQSGQGKGEGERESERGVGGMSFIQGWAVQSLRIPSPSTPTQNAKPLPSRHDSGWSLTQLQEVNLLQTQILSSFTFFHDVLMTMSFQHLGGVRTILGPPTDLTQDSTFH